MDIQTIETVQRTFSHEITEVQHLNYWERLHTLKLDFLQRRRERYIITYIWRTTQHMVSNIDQKPSKSGTQFVIEYRVKVKGKVVYG